ncbi:MAG: hypothetical protein GC157_01170 [Frankiales bacterium]|nr:hypothetical protein [Frankiales bacterium]
MTTHDPVKAAVAAALERTENPPPRAPTREEVFDAHNERLKDLGYPPRAYTDSKGRLVVPDGAEP